jgi:dihydropteroate synthase
VRDVYTELQNKQKELIQLGMKRLIIDPGFGFSKTLEQNYALMQNLDFFKNLNAPILVGISRKSMIYKLLNTDADTALNGSTALHTIALLKGANILRVHDVKEAVEVRSIIDKLSNPFS